MTLVLVLVGTVVFAFACKRPIKACPMAFYALAVVLDVLFVVGSFMGLPAMLYDVLFLLLHKCTLATALFAVVMYIGVFARDGRVAQYFRPIRAELSIMRGCCRWATWPSTFPRTRAPWRSACRRRTWPWRWWWRSRCSCCSWCWA
ncbi:hypothetical protein [Eggerthella sinensis]|uniref:hypothetical protein n=1 Tax=Eggerthella sinensis TaxID=242230 RepID=UPI0022E87ED1|nr:hypothetical protein [Eggerthella sinensis]